MNALTLCLDTIKTREREGKQYALNEFPQHPRIIQLCQYLKLRILAKHT